MRELVDKRKAQEASGADVSALGPPELVYAYNDRCEACLLGAAMANLCCAACRVLQGALTDLASCASACVHDRGRA